MKRHQVQGNFYKGKNLMPMAYTFRGSVHYHQSSIQADIVLEKGSRVQQANLKAARRDYLATLD